MVKLLFVLDEKKVEECGEYTVEQIYNYIDEIFAMTTITKVEELEQGKMYYGNGNNQDLVNIYKPILHFRKEDWFLKYSKKIIFYDNSMQSNENEFEIEDVLYEARKLCKQGNIKYA